MIIQKEKRCRNRQLVYKHLTAYDQTNLLPRYSVYFLRLYVLGGSVINEW